VLLAHCGAGQWQCVVAYVKTERGDLQRSEILKFIKEETGP